jgi:hypothetical protein
VAVERGLSAGAVDIARSRVPARLRRRIEQRGDTASPLLSQENRREIIARRFDQILRESQGLGW